MTEKYFSVLSMLIIAVLMAAIPAVYAQTSPGDFTNEPDKNMAAAHESFLKGEMNKVGRADPQGSGLCEEGGGQGRQGHQRGREEGR